MRVRMCCCQLFGWSSNALRSGRQLPLAEFRARGGATADNPDGRGVAWRVGDAFRLEREPRPGFDSAQFNRVIDALHSDLIVAHVRKARFPPSTA
ncbi:MAG: hypothetical protein A3E25_05120 [Burkholderiales bacterium RIFCSPHIGHO2_12_FULL_69_20]|nr:MAG: hypothetical protein A3E25_05120 [Burkholderiales bacterium RIFCSPHIGHO2_12_FULL_69_20]